MRLVPLALLPVVVASLSPAAPIPEADSAPATKLHYEGDLLTATIDNASRGEVVEALRRETGANIRGGDDDTEPVQQRFERVPLRDALEHHLGWRNFVLQYVDGRLTSIDFLPSPPETPPSAPPRAPAAAPPAPAPARAPGMPPTMAPAAAPETAGPAMLGRPHPTWQPAAQPLAGQRAPAPRPGAAAGARAPAAPSQPAAAEAPQARRLGRPWPQAAFATIPAVQPGAAATRKPPGR